MKINRNMSAVMTNKQLLRTENRLQKSMERLSSGFKINSAGENPAGMAISNKMRAQIDALNQAKCNAQDGVSVVQIADGALSEVSNMLQRIRELAVQAANDTNGYEDKQAILNESTLLGRLEKLLVLLHQECEVLAIERDIDDKVNMQMDKGQREYYLREQLNVISEELGDTEDTRSEAEKYRQKVRALELEPESTEKLLKECDRLARMQSSSPESGVIRSYLDTCLALPWHTATQDDLDQAHARCAS